MDRRYSNKINLLLSSVKHPIITQLAGCPTYHSWYYTLESKDDTRLHFAKTTDDIDYPAAVTNAFVYACWLGELEMVKLVVHNLRKYIDVNRLVAGKNAIEWAARAFRNCNETHANVCRYLIITLGSKINANLSGLVLEACVHHSYADLVAYLVTKYGASLVHSRYVANVFAFLARNGYSTEAELYLWLFRDKLAPDFWRDALKPSIQGSTHLFMITLDMFGRDLNPTLVDIIVGDLCEAYDYAKLGLALDMWAECVRIEYYLVGQWYASYHARLKGRYDIAVSCCQTGQLITERCVNQLEDKPTADPSFSGNREVGIIRDRRLAAISSPDQSASRTGKSIQVALALCCFLQNLELIDTVIDHNLNQINASSRLVSHAILECLSLGDIDTLTYLLNKCGPPIYPMTLEYACEAGDLEAVTILFETRTSSLLDIVPKVFVSACVRGDTELAELLIGFSDSIDDVFYRRAMRGACYSGYADVVTTLAGHQDHIDFRPGTDYELDVENVETSIIELLNCTFGTSIDPAVGTCSNACFTKGSRSRGVCISYKDKPSVWYKLN